MQFIFSKSGVLIIENGKGTYNREGYIYLSQDFLRLKGTYNRELFDFCKRVLIIEAAL